MAGVDLLIVVECSCKMCINVFQQCHITCNHAWHHGGEGGGVSCAAKNGLNGKKLLRMHNMYFFFLNNTDNQLPLGWI